MSTLISPQRPPHPIPGAAHEAMHAPRLGRVAAGVWRGSALMIASALVALAVLAGYNQSSTQRAMRRQLDARVADAATISTAYMATHIQTLSTNLEYYATRPNLIDLVRSGAARRGELTSLLSSLRLDVLAVAAVSVLDPSGHVVATTGGSQFVGVDESQQDYFRGALRAGKTYLSSAYSSTPTSSRLLANVITPIPGATSTGSAGYLTAAVPLDQLQALVVQFAQQSGLGVAVTDQNGVTTASSLGQQLGRIDPRTGAGSTRRCAARTA